MADRLPPPERGPRRLDGPKVLSYTVGDWSPSPDASIPPTAVGVALQVEWRFGEPPVDLVFRLHTPRAVDNMIATLLRHKRSVWPEAP